MSKKVLVISSSLRHNSNSAALAARFAAGAREAGHTVEEISLTGKNIGFCKGCLACQKTGRCIINDDTAQILPKMRQADVIVFATPVYFYEMAGQMKTLLDRSNPLFPSQYAFREIYLLAAAADTDETSADRAKAGLEGWAACFDKCVLKGVVFAGGADAPGSVNNHPAVQKAFDAGKRV